MKIVIAQLNPTIGDLQVNTKKAMRAIKTAGEEKADLIVFSELYLSGYPARDLLERPDFIFACEKALDEICKASMAYPNLGIIIGSPTKTPKKIPPICYNSAVLIQRGQRLFTQHKTLLPDYDVFDDKRYFLESTTLETVDFKNQVLGISICEDAWNPDTEHTKGRYKEDPISDLAIQGATVLINLSASPFEKGKPAGRQFLMSHHAKKHRIPMILVNQVGGNDELVFDGNSFALNEKGECIEKLTAFEQDLVCIDMSSSKIKPVIKTHKMEEIKGAIVCGIKDYVHKSGFKKTVIGLSGGIDSAVVATLAVEALGAKNVTTITMPSPYSSEGSWLHSQQLATNLGCRCDKVDISSLFQSYQTLFKTTFTEVDSLTEENIQARIRGNILMAYSNQQKALLLATGNKSELSVGYCTLYGDMCGALNPIADLYKTEIYELANYLNSVNNRIPTAIIEKPPSAELKPNQIDQDTLPPYDELDAILIQYIEEKKSITELLLSGSSKNNVFWVVNRFNQCEYKRRQAAPAIKLTKKAFGIGRRFMMTQQINVN